MNLRYYPYTLQFRHPFRIAHGIRETTPVVYLELQEGVHTGYGEAALPPYLPENTQSVCDFFQKIDLKKFSDLSSIEPILTYVNGVEEGNFAAKAAFDIALHDLTGKIQGISLKKIFQTEGLPAVSSTFTLGMSSIEEMEAKIADAGEFNVFKLKLGSEDDKKLVENFLFVMNSSRTEKKEKWSFCVDVNQGWKDAGFAMEMVYWLSEKGAFLIEQPLPKNRIEEVAKITEKSPVPIVADESVQTVADIENIRGAFSGINIKLMKCGGLKEAFKMIELATKYKMKILIGCMSESSCAVAAAAHLAPFADLADLDGPFLIKNDPFEGITVKEGRIYVSDALGTGVKKVK